MFSCSRVCSLVGGDASKLTLFLFLSREPDKDADGPEVVCDGCEKWVHSEFSLFLSSRVVRSGG